ncbi:MAG: hypothetical protein LBF85_02525, partial [Tannerella sp.]|nr:hypothetical protein [Tannerella sp.]
MKKYQTIAARLHSIENGITGARNNPEIQERMNRYGYAAERIANRMTAFCCLFILPAAIIAQDIVQSGAGGKEWNITTATTVYRIGVSSKGEVQEVYYGNRLALENPPSALGAEVPVRGGYVNGTPSLEAVFPDGVRDVELEYQSGEIITADGRQTLKIIQRDRFYPLEIRSYIRVLPEYDLVEKWNEVANTGKKGVIRIENL